MGRTTGGTNAFQEHPEWFPSGYDPSKDPKKDERSNAVSAMHSGNALGVVRGLLFNKNNPWTAPAPAPTPTTPAQTINPQPIANPYMVLSGMENSSVRKAEEPVKDTTSQAAPTTPGIVPTGPATINPYLKLSRLRSQFAGTKGIY